MPQHVFVAGLVHAFFENEAATLSGLLQRPAGQDAGHFGDIFLGVAAVYAERVQFHQLAAIIFIQPAALAFGLFHRRGRRGRGGRRQL